VFDKTDSDATSPNVSEKRRRDPEDERIALRCNRRELQLLDSFVASGEFTSRSELMREALREFLRVRSRTAVENPRKKSDGAPEQVAVALRPEEVAAYRLYGELVANGQTLGDTLAQLVRRGDLEMKVSELVRRARETLREAAEVRRQAAELGRSADELERKGVYGR
jgi:Arc/MetJ-type ribon-helix-helix transcriptional regulator